MPKTLDDSYEKLVQKAQVLFWNMGYNGVSAQELADHLGVSSSTIYNKYSKEMLFIDSLEYYNITCSDPFLKQLREATNGMEALKDFFYALIDALMTKTFPRSCLMVNTVVELRDENATVNKLYERYFSNLVNSYKVVVEKAINLGEIKHPERIDEYAKFLLGMIFELSILYKLYNKEFLQQFVNEQLALIE